MDLDLNFLSAVLRGKGSFFIAKKHGINSTMLDGPAVDGWKFVEDHVLEFGTVPTIEFFTAKTNIDLLDVSEELIVLIKDIKDRFLWQKLIIAHKQSGDALEKHKPRDAIQVFQNIVHDSYKEGIIGGKVLNLLSLGDDVLNFYERMKKGERGILTPWKAMNDMTLGWWGGDFVVFVARVSTGKTFTALMLAREAWLSGKKVLFVGTEMSVLKLALRFYSIHLQLPYQEIRKGHLDAFKEVKLKESIGALKNVEGLDVLGNDFNAAIGEIEAAVEQVRPDILFIDGLYLVKNLGRGRQERVANTADDLKRLALRKNIPIITTTQFNREVANNNKSSVAMGNIGISDVIGWDADCVFGMYQTEDMREDSIMGFRPLKIREGAGGDFFCKWDFGTMVFTQEDTEDDGFKDDDFDHVPRDDWKDDGESLF